MPPTREDLLKDLGYSDKSIQYIQQGQNLGELPVFTNRTSHIGQCGDMLRLYLDMDGDRVRKASFELTGCAGLQACASGLTTMLEGMTLEEARKIDVEQIVGFLGGLPEAKTDCAELTRDTLHKAIQELDLAQTVRGPDRTDRGRAVTASFETGGASCPRKPRS